MYLQNVIPTGAVAHQELGLTLALCEHYLAGRGAYRVHGGGFAGTVQAFVPLDRLESFQSGDGRRPRKGRLSDSVHPPMGRVEIRED